MSYLNWTTHQLILQYSQHCQGWDPGACAPAVPDTCVEEPTKDSHTSGRAVGRQDKNPVHLQ